MTDPQQDQEQGEDTGPIHHDGDGCLPQQDRLVLLRRPGTGSPADANALAALAASQHGLSLPQTTAKSSIPAGSSPRKPSGSNSGPDDVLNDVTSHPSDRARHARVSSDPSTKIPTSRGTSNSGFSSRRSLDARQASPSTRSMRQYQAYDARLGLGPNRRLLRQPRRPQAHPGSAPEQFATYGFARLGGGDQRRFEAAQRTCALRWLAVLWKQRDTRTEEFTSQLDRARRLIR